MIMEDLSQRLQFNWHNTRQRFIDNGCSSWLLKKVLVRLTTSLTAMIGAALFAAAAGAWVKNFEHAKGPVKGDWQDGIPLSSLLLSFVYNLFSAMWVFWNARPVYPLIDGIVDLLVWVILAPGVFFAAWGGLFILWHLAVIESEGRVSSTWAADEWRVQGVPILFRIGRLEVGGAVFGVIVWVITTILLVHGWCEAMHPARYSDDTSDRVVLIEFDESTPRYRWPEKGMEICYDRVGNWSQPTRIALPQPPPKCVPAYDNRDVRLVYYDLR